MTEDEGRLWLADRFGSQAVERIDPFLRAVAEENGRQNLVAAASLHHLWVRHAVDSAQLIAFAPDKAASWLDIGTGAGFPGMIVALLCAMPITMVEPRRRRAEFLESVARSFALTHVEVLQAKVERVSGRFDVISARAVAAIDALLGSAVHLSNDATTWVLPKGRAGREEVAATRKSWLGSFHVEHSITDAESAIIVARGVTRR